MGVTEDEMVRWHLQHNGHESEQIPGDSEGQRSLVCYSSWGRKELDMTQQLKNYSDKGSLDLLKDMLFPDQLKHTKILHKIMRGYKKGKKYAKTDDHEI